MIRAHTLQKSTMFNFAKCLEAKRKDVDVEYRWELQLVVHSPGLGKAASSLHRKTEEQWLIRAHTVIISLSVWRRGRGILTWDIAGGCSWRIVLVSSPLPSPPSSFGYVYHPGSYISAVEKKLLALQCYASGLRLI